MHNNIASNCNILFTYFKDFLLFQIRFVFRFKIWQPVSVVHNVKQNYCDRRQENVADKPRTLYAVTTQTGFFRAFLLTSDNLN